MSDSREVIEVLQDARELVRDDWTSNNPDVPFEKADGMQCASVAIICSASEYVQSVILPAHVAFLCGAGVTVPRDRETIYQAVYDFNDAQTSRVPVLAAFDRAIAMIERLSPSYEILVPA